MIAQPTAPLKATFSRIATAPSDASAASLARSNHSLTIVGHRAYIFGGEVADGKLASNDVHVVNLLKGDEAEKHGEAKYALLPALEVGATGGEASGIRSERRGGVPVARARHAACALNICVAVFGGCDAEGEVVDEGGRVWLFNTAHSAWEVLEPRDGGREVPVARAEGKMFEHQNCLVLYGGRGKGSRTPLKDVWHFSYVERVWTRLPDSPEPASNASLADGTLHLLTSSSPASSLSGAIHSLIIPHPLELANPPTWTSLSFPSNPLTPAPAPRLSGGLLPITTGHGRFYLLHFFGARLSPSTQTSRHATAAAASPLDPSTTSQPTQYADLWTLQLPSTPSSSAPAATTTSTVLEALRPAAIKDSIRGILGASTGTHGWAEADVVPPDLETLGNGEAGKVHPGPRAFFGCDVLRQGEGKGRTVVLWGGVNARGEREGDGWLIALE